MVMEVVVGDNQRSRRWLAGYADHCPRGMMTDESTNQRMPWIKDSREQTYQSGAAGLYIAFAFWDQPEQIR